MSRNSVPHTRHRYIDATGRKRGVLAIDRRDRSPRYQGPGDPDQCPHCQSGAPHSSALHSQFVEERKEEWEE